MRRWDLQQHRPTRRDAALLWPSCVCAGIGCWWFSPTLDREREIALFRLGSASSGSSGAKYKYFSPTFETSLSDSITDETVLCDIPVSLVLFQQQQIKVCLIFHQIYYLFIDFFNIYFVALFFRVLLFIFCLWKKKLSCKLLLFFLLLVPRFDSSTDFFSCTWMHFSFQFKLVWGKIVLVVCKFSKNSCVFNRATSVRFAMIFTLKKNYSCLVPTMIQKEKRNWKQNKIFFKKNL